MKKENFCLQYKKLIIQEMKLIVGLGNPWLEYRSTRHNIWFMFLDFLANSYGFEEFRDSKFRWLISEWTHNWEKFILLKPLTYMNLSWESLVSIINFYKINIEDLVVIYDDVSMDFGKIRFRLEWTAGWHNWIKSIINVLGIEKFARIKIWIWNDPKYDLSDWVLAKFKNEELEELEKNIFPKTLELLEDKFIS